MGRCSRAVRPAADGGPPCPGHPAGRRRLPGVDPLRRRRRADRATDRVDDRERRPFLRVYRPFGRPWRPGERVRNAALASTLEAIAAGGFEAFDLGDLGSRRARGLDAAGCPITVDDLRDHASTWTDPIAVDYRGVRVTTHPPNSSGIVALEILAILAQLEPPGPTAFGPDGVTDPRWIHAGIEAAKLAMADRDAHLTDPDSRDIPVARLLDPAYAAGLAARIDPRRAAGPARATNPSGGGTVYLAVVDRDGNAVSLIQSLYGTFGSGVLDPDTGVLYQNRGSYFSLDPEHPNALAPGKRTLHTLLPGMLFRDGVAAPWVVAGAAGGDAQPQVHAQLVSALVDGGLDLATAVSAPRWFVEPAAHFDPPVEVRLEPRHAAGIRAALEGLGHPVTEVAPFDPLLGQEHAIELVEGGPARPRARSWPSPTRAATGCRRPGDRRPVRALRRGSVCDTRASGGGQRSHDAATGPLPGPTRSGACRELERRPELSVHERDRGGNGRPASRP